MGLRKVFDELAKDSQQERATLAAIGFTGGFAACRGVTHAIKHNIPPFHNFSSKGGTHIHHSTFGIFGLLGIGFVWAQQVFIGHDDPPRWGSRISATMYGVASALTLDEFALWLDLHDDYWDAAGRKSIDAVVIFGGLLNVTVLASEALAKSGYAPAAMHQLSKLDLRRQVLNARSSGPEKSGGDGDGGRSHHEGNGTAPTTGAGSSPAPSA